MRREGAAAGFGWLGLLVCWATATLGRPTRQARDGAGRPNGQSATAEGNVLFLSSSFFSFFFSLFAYFLKYFK
jgi:hypothetical protein